MVVVSHLELSHPSEIYQLYHGCLGFAWNIHPKPEGRTITRIALTFLYVSYYAYTYCVRHMYHTTLTMHVIFHTLTVHITFLYVLHYACLLCISVHITLHLLYMSHFCTTLTVHVTFLHYAYAYCACHISVCITLCSLCHTDNLLSVF